MAEKITFAQLPPEIQRHYLDPSRIRSITVSMTKKGEEQYTITLRNGAKYQWKFRSHGWVRFFAN